MAGQRGPLSLHSSSRAAGRANALDQQAFDSPAFRLSAELAARACMGHHDTVSQPGCQFVAVTGGLRGQAMSDC